ncbi:MAG TPA: DNA-binding response regulator [Cytophagales bacterium]|nr:DNA-binding response regulator [Cytophagales bacterium]HAA20238.1 DNA-binding response regulator [Cytophagales bacterium]HAP61772.1 DNA-binding response regulator [Cytophagales bacterium]
MIRYIIVDDETVAHRIIQGYAEKVPWLQLQGQAYDGLEAMNLLKSQPVDLIFLDINMPLLTGFELLGTLAHPPKVIITSAYQEHALKGYEFDVVDYLLKPFSFERFLKAVNKVELATARPTAGVETPTQESIYVKVERRWEQIALNSIYYIEGHGNYAKIFREEGLCLTSLNLASMEDVLPSHDFLRIHKSFIVARRKVTSIGTKVEIMGNYLPIGETYRKQVLEEIKSNK